MTNGLIILLIVINIIQIIVIHKFNVKIEILHLRMTSFIEMHNKLVEVYKTIEDVIKSE